ncbi:MAG TPA: YceD family protein [Chthoniobacteraceae bacterium]|jgi:uncharacterized metal-binding protein YceD (DUF177 family)|nr:YceD family protein [Chthoniobacteraceae bacterium]
MKIHLNQIPAGGAHLEGEEPASILQLDEDPLVRPQGPVRYSLEVGLSDGGLFATGRLGVDLEMECGSCLKRFSYPLRIEDFATQVELTGSETVDLTEQVREDILLALPPYPHCDWNGQNVCKGAAPEGKQEENPEEPTQTWAELDKLKFKNK